MTPLKTMALESNVEFIDYGNGHIQLKGPLLVNYYPDSKKRKAYVSGTTTAIAGVTPEQAIKMCFEPPKPQGQVDKRQRNNRRRRQRLIDKGTNSCIWCKTKLTIDTSSLEHVIPLSRGGLDNPNNWALACIPCNGARGSNMPELARTSEGE